MPNRDIRFFAGWIIAVIALAVLGYEINAPERPVTAPPAAQATDVAGAASHG